MELSTANPPITESRPKLDKRVHTHSHREIQAEVKKTWASISIFQGVSIISGLGSLMVFHCNCYDVRVSVRPNGLLKTTRTDWFHSLVVVWAERHRSPEAQISAGSSAEKVRSVFFFLLFSTSSKY